MAKNQITPEEKARRLNTKADRAAEQRGTAGELQLKFDKFNVVLKGLSPDDQMDIISYNSTIRDDVAPAVSERARTAAESSHEKKRERNQPIYQMADAFHRESPNTRVPTVAARVQCQIKQEVRARGDNQGQGAGELLLLNVGDGQLNEIHILSKGAIEKIIYRHWAANRD